MGRTLIEPRKYGIDQTRQEFIDNICDAFAATYFGKVSVDEFLLHPKEAIWFCDEIRWRYQYVDLPDELILRALMDLRKYRCSSPSPRLSSRRRAAS